MEVAFFTEEEKQTVLKNLKEILRLHAEIAKKKNQEVPVSNADFITMMKISPRTAQSWRDLGIIVQNPVKLTPCFRRKLTPHFRWKVTPFFRSKLTP
ncbi:MAG: hypothetical protein ACYC1Q_14255, partial [Bacteroidia bacterium]